MEYFYLDNAATTMMHQDAINEATGFLNADFFNPSAVYDKAVEVKRKIDEARGVILSLLGADDGRLIFTGSATEANNMVIFSNKNLKNKKFLFGAGEHPSVMECAKELKRQGADVEFVPLDKNGQVDTLAFEKMLDSSVCFVSIQHVSNETGAINPIKKLVKMARRVNKNVLFHSDGVQAFMKLDFSVADLDVDYYTISAHKIGGPKGVGALYVKKGAKILPLVFGGGQESGTRSGTENVFNIVGFMAAAKIMDRDRAKNEQKLSAMRSELLCELKKNNIDYILHGEGMPNIMSVSLSRSVRGETLLHALEKRGVYVSTGSACSSNKNFNATLEAMGISSDEILTSIRISLSPYMEFDAQKIAKIIKEELTKLEGKNYGKMSSN